jgi:hypothetical protein
VRGVLITGEIVEFGGDSLDSAVIVFIQAEEISTNCIESLFEPAGGRYLRDFYMLFRL